MISYNILNIKVIIKGDEMSFGKLEFILFIGEEALPVSDAEIVIINTDTSQIVNNKILKVDSNGRTRPVSLYTYQKYLSEMPEESVKPYKTYDAMIISNSLQNKYIKNIPIFSDVTSIQKVQMTPKLRNINSMDVIDIPPNALIKSENGEDEFYDDNISIIGEDKAQKILKEVVIPEYVTVHLGSPTSSAANVRVLFTDYIKNVASSEIYPTWPKAALESNIYAQISFTLNRIYTEWYRSRGYDFDITNSTAYDHYFVNGRNIFDTISDVVDEIFNEYISKKSYKEPLLAQYCNGTTVTCSGLSQWGSVSYANNGETAMKILTRYYGSDIEVRTSNEVQGIPQSYPGTALRIGDSGESVKEIQKQLNRIRKNYPAIPEIVNESGEFNESTKNSVKAFQKIFSLTQDGIVGKQTWYKISQIYVGVKKLAELDSEGEAITIPSVLPTEVLKLGSQGENVKIAQYLLICISAFYDDVSHTELNGIYNSKMYDAVVSFQRRFGLSVDGIIGNQTWAMLNEVYKDIEPYILDAAGKFIKYPGHVIKKGKKGDDVKQIQVWINGIHNKYNFIPFLNVDGAFGDKTKEAIMKFQRWTGLVEDGLVGSLTWNKLFEIYVKCL